MRKHLKTKTRNYVVQTVDMYSYGEILPPPYSKDLASALFVPMENSKSIHLLSREKIYTCIFHFFSILLRFIRQLAQPSDHHQLHSSKFICRRAEDSVDLVLIMIIYMSEWTR